MPHRYSISLVLFVLFTLGTVLSGMAQPAHIGPLYYSSFSKDTPQIGLSKAYHADSLSMSGLKLIGGAVAGGISGLFLGGTIGHNIETSYTECDYNWCGLRGVIYGSIIGETLLLPLSLHQANGRRGNYGLSLLLCSATTAAGLYLAHRNEESTYWAMIPLAHLAISFHLETRTRKSR
jgi:hypothetical protein